MKDASLPREFFEQIYAGGADPWAFATSDYEREKYDRTLAALAPHYPAALEIGCSIGVFSERLARRCGTLVAVDISEHALETARVRCALPNVTFERADITRDFPAQPFDLIVLSEVGYYWSDEDLQRGRDAIAAGGPPGGDIVLVHFLPKVPEYPRDGDDVHAAFLADPRFMHAEAYRAERYRLDRFTRR